MSGGLLLRGFDSFVLRNPLLFSAGFGTTKNVVADLLIQKQVERRESIDWRRLGTFASFGAVWVGAGQYMLFNKLLPRAFPGLLQGKLLPAGCAVAFDQLVHMPFMYLPFFYSIREFAYGEGGFDQACIEGGLAAWKTNVIEDMAAQWALFVPLQVPRRSG